MAIISRNHQIERLRLWSGRGRIQKGDSDSKALILGRGDTNGKMIGSGGGGCHFFFSKKEKKNRPKKKGVPSSDQITWFLFERKKMSAINRLKNQIRQNQANFVGGLGKPTSFGPRGKEDRGDLIRVLPKKPKNKQKIQCVIEEADDSLRRNPSGGKEGETNPLHEEIDDEEIDEDMDEDEEDDKRIPWGPTSVLDHLNEPPAVTNLDAVFSTFHGEDVNRGKKKKEQKIVVWDHGATPKGKISDNNFFLWFEAYSAQECRVKRERENKIFEA